MRMANGDGQVAARNFSMQAKFNLRYRTDDALDTPITGTFNGPLRRVAVRILDDYDFAMKMMSEGIDVLVLRRKSARQQTGRCGPARQGTRPIACASDDGAGG
jgi:hypothetical protein